MPNGLIALTERQKREMEFYSQYASKFDVNREIDLSPVAGIETRPWNSYWAVYQIAQENFKHGAVLLDFGSGPGENALRFSHIGYRIEGFDVCSSNVLIAKEIFSKYNISHRGNFRVAAAEKLPYPDNHFDIIAGIDILHHVDIENAIQECHRVLRPGGVAIFREPIEVPFLDWIRNLAIVRWCFPKEKSFDLHITEDERKLNLNDLMTIKTIFPQMVEQKFFFFARFDRFYRKVSAPSPSLLEILDFKLMKLFPFLKKLGGVVVMTLKKEKE